VGADSSCLFFFPIAYVERLCASSFWKRRGPLLHAVYQGPLLTQGRREGKGEEYQERFPPPLGATPPFLFGVGSGREGLQVQFILFFLPFLELARDIDAGKELSRKGTKVFAVPQIFVGTDIRHRFPSLIKKEMARISSSRCRGLGASTCPRPLSPLRTIKSWN